MDIEQKKVIFSGIQPSGMLTIGNYLGSLRNWVGLQDEYECYYCIVDLHAITVRQEPAKLRRNCLELLALYIACGLSPEKSAIYFQSHVPAHSELAWILNCFTYMGELSRMTQYKDKSQKQGANVGAGLFTYPVLMAADILLYNADLVPIGQDQKQHLELTRNIAERFNNIYGETFKIPEAYIPKCGAKIMSLQEPSLKMSKSDENVNAFISMMDDETAVTDSEGGVIYSEEKKGIKNLIEIYSACTGKSIQEIECEFAGLGYGQFKEAVGSSVWAVLSPIQSKQKELLADKAYLEKIYTSAAERADYTAGKMLRKVQKKVGLAPKKL